MNNKCTLKGKKVTEGSDGGQAGQGQGGQAGWLPHLSISAQGPLRVAIQPTGFQQQLTYPPIESTLRDSLGSTNPRDEAGKRLRKAKTQENAF